MELPPFQALLDAHGVDVHRFLVGMVGRESADDCYQETWLSALRAYPGLRDAANLRGWVFTIAHRKALDHHRARARAPVAVGGAVERAGSVDAAGVADAGLWARVAALPVKQRAAVALRFLADLAYGEIGAAMGTSEDAARRNVHEALKRLRREMDD